MWFWIPPAKPHLSEWKIALSLSMFNIHYCCDQPTDPEQKDELWHLISGFLQQQQLDETHRYTETTPRFTPDTPSVYTPSTKEDIWRFFQRIPSEKHPQRDAAPLTFRSAAWLSTSSAPLANVLFARWTDLWKFPSFLSLTESPNKSMMDQDVSVTTQASRETRSWRAEGVL